MENLDTCAGCGDPLPKYKLDRYAPNVCTYECSLRARILQLELTLMMVWDYLDRGGSEDIEMAYKLDPVLRGCSAEARDKRVIARSIVRWGWAMNDFVHSTKIPESESSDETS